MDPAAAGSNTMFTMENDSLKLLDDLQESMVNGTGGDFAGVNEMVRAYRSPAPPPALSTARCCQQRHALDAETARWCCFCVARWPSCSVRSS